MPDGGYPLHLVTPFVDSSFVLYLRGADIHFKERFFPDPESKKFQLVSHGALSEPQVDALLFHLLEWGRRDGSFRDPEALISGAARSAAVPHLVLLVRPVMGTSRGVSTNYTNGIREYADPLGRQRLCFDHQCQTPLAPWNRPGRNQGGTSQ